MSCSAVCDGASRPSPLETSPLGMEASRAPSCISGERGKHGVGTWAPGTSRGEMGLGPQRSSVSLAVAVATCAPRPPDVLSAGEGVVDVGAAAAAPCVKSLSRASSYSGVVIHPAECVPWRAWTPRTSGGERRSRTSCSSYVVANTGRIESSKLSSMPPPTESAGGTADHTLMGA